MKMQQAPAASRGGGLSTCGGVLPVDVGAVSTGLLGFTPARPSRTWVSSWSVRKCVAQATVACEPRGEISVQETAELQAGIQALLGGESPLFSRHREAIDEGLMVGGPVSQSMNFFNDTQGPRTGEPRPWTFCPRLSTSARESPADLPDPERLVVGLLLTWPGTIGASDLQQIAPEPEHQLSHDPAWCAPGQGNLPPGLRDGLQGPIVQPQLDAVPVRPARQAAQRITHGITHRYFKDGDVCHRGCCDVTVPDVKIQVVASSRRSSSRVRIEAVW